MVSVPADDHLPDRPWWDCVVCRRPWPCDTARERLAQVYGRTTLPIFMVDRLVEAVRDGPTMPPSELFERFLSWTGGTGPRS